MSLDPDTQRGLYPKYQVKKIKRETDQRGEEVEVLVEPKGRCFVLDYDNDPYAKFALTVYAQQCHYDYQQLSADLFTQLGKKIVHLPTVTEPDGGVRATCNCDFDFLDIRCVVDA